MDRFDDYAPSEQQFLEWAINDEHRDEYSHPDDGWTMDANGVEHYDGEMANMMRDRREEEARAAALEAMTPWHPCPLCGLPVGDEKQCHEECIEKAAAYKRVAVAAYNYTVAAAGADESDRIEAFDELLGALLEMPDD